jgi:hypothetical protein
MIDAKTLDLELKIMPPRSLNSLLRLVDLNVLLRDVLPSELLGSEIKLKETKSISYKWG